jgi:hypothetical protein
MLQETSERLRMLINGAKERFASIDEATWNAQRSPGKWSKKEILGHLVDSAANNHLRFVKAQLADDIFTGTIYEQDLFVSSQRYRDENIEELIELWYAYNRHLVHVIKHIDPEKLNIVCRIGHYPDVTFSFLITDYVTHLEHHLEQLLS